MQGDDDGHYFFFSAPASPVHYILRSPPSSTAAASSPCFAASADADCCAAAAGDFEFAAHGSGHGPGPGPGPDGAVAMSSAEELFVAGRIRIGCLSPIRQDAGREEGSGGEEEEAEAERDGRSPRATRRARSASPTRSPRADRGACAEPSDTFASSSSSSSSAKNIRRRISLRDLLSRTGGDCAGADQASSGAEVTSRPGFWPPSIWPSPRSSTKNSPLPCPAPQPGRRSTSSDRAAAAPGGGSSARRTTSLPYRQSLVLGCLGFGARSRSYGARQVHAPHLFPLNTKS